MWPKRKALRIWAAMSEVTAEMIERGRRGDPEEASRRRKMNMKIKHVRHALTSSRGDDAGPFDSMVRLFAESARSAAPAIALLTLAVGAAAHQWAPLNLTLAWMAASLTMLAARYLVGAKYLSLPNPEAEARIYRRVFVAMQLFDGAAWASGVLLLIISPDPSAHGFMLVLLALIAGVIAMTASAIPAAVGAGLAPIVLAALWGLGAKSTIEFALQATFCVGVLLYFIVLANRLLRSALAGLSFQEEKDALIAELEQAKYNSDEARRRAESANLAKSRFLATMSHELRTPLNAILGFSEVMKSELFGPHASPSYLEYASDIHASGQHLLMLINEILDLSRVEAGRYELKEEAVSLAGVVEDCRHLLALRARTKNIEIIEDIEDGLPRIWADERALRQITLNILSNAIKFTPQGGVVTLKVNWSENRGQYLSIRDTGPGIPEAEIPVVLSSFGRGSMAQKHAEEGSGLGLPIVRGLVELHGGEFTLKSKVREGTEVIVSFPPERVMNALASLDPNGPSEAEIEAKRAARAKRWSKRAEAAA
jgi:two-component system cell cycle sensor histidine kinase PleC